MAHSLSFLDLRFRVRQVFKPLKRLSNLHFLCIDDNCVLWENMDSVNPVLHLLWSFMEAAKLDAQEKPGRGDAVALGWWTHFPAFPMWWLSPFLRFPLPGFLANSPRLPPAEYVNVPRGDYHQVFTHLLANGSCLLSMFLDASLPFFLILFLLVNLSIPKATF